MKSRCRWGRVEVVSVLFVVVELVLSVILAVSVHRRRAATGTAIEGGSPSARVPEDVDIVLKVRQALLAAADARRRVRVGVLSRRVDAVGIAPASGGSRPVAIVAGIAVACRRRLKKRRIT